MIYLKREARRLQAVFFSEILNWSLVRLFVLHHAGFDTDNDSVHAEYRTDSNGARLLIDKVMEDQCERFSTCRSGTRPYVISLH